MIVAKELTKRYGEITALDGVSFEARSGEILGYLGPNGAGKSTTISILTGLLAPDSGSASISGYDVAAAPVEAKARVGYVPEVPAVYETLTPEEFLGFVGRIRKLPESTIATRTPLLLDLFEIGDRARFRMGGFSKGMRQKVLLAAALLHDPEVLILDEPLSGLDAPSALLLREILRGLRDAGKTILYSSHILEVVEKIADRVVILAKGRVVAQGTVEELLRAKSGEAKRHLEDLFRERTEIADPEARARHFLAELRERRSP
ncbi:MAG: ABC transporter ATP-binding protein [Planctomycetes bacterium]|nr:ABC transporter ATP-binding protein [Planctomycetota bacterium]MBI3845236.1 ABC transporter ATP-binding protein [Planctomycetota bacterium]